MILRTTLSLSNIVCQSNNGCFDEAMLVNNFVIFLILITYNQRLICKGQYLAECLYLQMFPTSQFLLMSLNLSISLKLNSLLWCWSKKSQHFPTVTKQRVFFRKQIKPSRKPKGNNKFRNKSESTFMNSFCYKRDIKGLLQIQFFLTLIILYPVHLIFSSHMAPYGGLCIIYLDVLCSQYLD